MMKLRINPFVVTDLKEICDYIAEDNAMRSIMRSGCVSGGGGSTLYELCACGTPAITYVLADNQIENAVKFESTGYMMYAGDCRAGDSFKKNLAVFWEYGVTL